MHQLDFSVHFGAIAYSPGTPKTGKEDSKLVKSTKETFALMDRNSFTLLTNLLLNFCAIVLTPFDYVTVSKGKYSHNRKTLAIKTIC